MATVLPLVAELGENEQVESLGPVRAWWRRKENEKRTPDANYVPSQQTDETYDHSNLRRSSRVRPATVVRSEPDKTAVTPESMCHLWPYCLHTWAQTQGQL